MLVMMSPALIPEFSAAEPSTTDKTLGVLLVGPYITASKKSNKIAKTKLLNTPAHKIIRR